MVTNRCFSGSEAVKSSCCINAIEIYSIQTGKQSVVVWEKKLLGAFYMISEWVLFKNEFIHQQDSPIPQEVKKEIKKNKTKPKKIVYSAIPK